MKTIEEIQRELRGLADELEHIKEARPSEKFGSDWERISADAFTKAIKPHPLEGFDKYWQKRYITILLTVVALDEQGSEKGLFLVYRIAFGMGYLEKYGSLMEEYKSAKTLSYKLLDDLLGIFSDKDEKLMLILECLLIAGTFEKSRNIAVKYIARLSELLGLTEENMVFLSNLAAVVLTQDTSNYNCEIWNEWELFNCYLSALKIKSQVIYATDIPKSVQDDEINFSLWGSRRYTFTKCKKVTLDGEKSVLKLVCTYSAEHGVATVQRTFTQNVPEPFILFATASEVFPKSPVGVNVDLLTPISFAKEKYTKALNKFNKENNNED